MTNEEAQKTTVPKGRSACQLIRHLDGLSEFRVESVPDDVPTRATLIRFGEGAFEWLGHQDDWQGRLGLVRSIKGSPETFQFLEYETPGDASIVVEFAPRPSA